VTHADFIFHFTSEMVEHERFGIWTENGEVIEHDLEEIDTIS